MIEGSATVRVQLDSRPESPALVRAALTGAAEQLGIESELFDDLMIAVSEACNNVVLHAYDGTSGPLAVRLEARPNHVEVAVRDWGGGIRQVEPSEDRMGVGLAVMSALADRAEFTRASEGGTEVRMAFTGRGSDARELQDQEAASPETGPLIQVSGDVTVTLTPAELLGGVLGRVARAVAARSQFSVDRLSDMSLATDAIASFAKAATAGDSITFATIAGSRRLELVVGPVRAGCGAWLQEDGLFNRPGSPLALLARELSLEPVDADTEMLRVVLDDHRSG